MHELAITQSIVDAVVESTGDARVRLVRLRIGQLSGVFPDAVRFCFELVAAETSMADAQLEISEPIGQAHCRGCDVTFETSDPIVLCACGSADVEVIGGRELRVTSVEVV